MFLLCTIIVKFCILFLSQEQLNKMEITQGSLISSSHPRVVYHTFGPIITYSCLIFKIRHADIPLSSYHFTFFLLFAFCSIYPTPSLFPTVSSGFSFCFYPRLLKQGYTSSSLSPSPVQGLVMEKHGIYFLANNLIYFIQ